MTLSPAGHTMLWPALDPDVYVPVSLSAPLATDSLPQWPLLAAPRPICTSDVVPGPPV
jgi:hypothetical protein